ncbi:hypothetical protein AAZV13_03G093700 [Glycine max]
MGYRCIQCWCPVKTLYVQYSPGNIRLMKCENCKAVADEYIECEIMGLLWKLAVIFLLFESYRCLILESSKGKLGSSNSVSSLVSICWKVLMDVIIGNLMFLLTFFFMVKMFFHVSITISRCIDLLLTLMISSYFKIFLIAMMVWDFPSSVIFIIELFCLSSNAAALKVMTESTMRRCVWTCFSAYAIKFIVTRILELILLGQLMQGWSQMPFTFSKATMI